MLEGFETQSISLMHGDTSCVSKMSTDEPEEIRSRWFSNFIYWRRRSL